MCSRPVCPLQTLSWNRRPMRGLASRTSPVGRRGQCLAEGGHLVPGTVSHLELRTLPFSWRHIYDWGGLPALLPLLQGFSASAPLTSWTRWSCGRGLSVLCRVFSSSCGLCSLEAGSASPASQAVAVRTTFRRCRKSCGGGVGKWPSLRTAPASSAFHYCVFVTFLLLRELFFLRMNSRQASSYPLRLGSPVLQSLFSYPSPLFLYRITSPFVPCCPLMLAPCLPIYMCDSLHSELMKGWLHAPVFALPAPSQGEVIKAQLILWNKWTTIAPAGQNPPW